ncbi:serine/threonine-protein kinase pim-1-like isoform X4 [Neoarius graeffei]|uniref:serine/threonine-protein kinase pim-1-like isoform X4 n=1 Tax=Neoarius graeffei TaxID=443677 RepID=UPI00298CB2BB|nr:serine/threonine-protein kinase pim-1-like isoform X4 [Neoarius graeffei]XP_060760595.1 serine/threonine-protein kinase pim-1-like isoform X4 [Neoarius graeffei]
MIVTPQEVLESRYIQGELLGQGGFGYVFAGVRKEDGKQVAIKYVHKTSDDKYINIPGEKDPLPLEVGLMLMTSTQSHCENVVELLEWFDVTEWIILVLERPSPCMDLQEYCSSYYNNEMPETLVRDIMWQVVQAARHCCDHGVLHRDIKSENLLINTETLQELLFILLLTGYMTDGVWDVLLLSGVWVCSCITCSMETQSLHGPAREGVLN